MDIQTHIDAARKAQNRLESLAQEADDANYLIISLANDAIDEALLKLADRRHCQVETFWIEEAIKDLDFFVEKANNIHKARG